MANRLKKAGYKVTEQEFDFPFYEELAPAQLSQVSPTPKDYETATYDYSGSGDVTGTVTPIDVVLPPTPDAELDERLRGERLPRPGQRPGSCAGPARRL